MTKLSDQIKALMDNPDDLSILAELHTQALEVEKQEAEYQLRIDNLQSSNRNLLKMIPQPQEPQTQEPQVEKINEAPTLEDGAKALHTYIGGQ
jgi:TolA-binding protein